jgi:TonB family protein
MGENTMKRYLSIVLILFASFFYTISYASDDSTSEEKAFKGNEVDKPPRVLRPAQPIYPSIRTIDGLIYTDGRVKIRFIVTKDGGVRSPVVVEAIPPNIFDASAIEALKKFRFAPAIKNGEPVDCIVFMPINYSLNGANPSLDALVVAQKGLNYIKAGEFENAVKAFTEAIKINKKYSTGYAGRGIAYMNLGEYEKAIEDFNMAIKKSSKIGLYYKLRGDAYSVLKNFDKAVEDFNSAIKIDPEMPEAYFERGNAFRNMEKYSEAVTDYSKVIELDKSYLQAYNNRAAAYNKLNDSENMCLDIKKACDLGDCRGFELAKNAGKCSADATGK